MHFGGSLFDSDVSVFSPVITPGVADFPISSAGFLVYSISDENHGVIGEVFFLFGGIEDSASVLLEGVIGVEVDLDGSVFSERSSELFFFCQKEQLSASDFVGFFFLKSASAFISVVGIILGLHDSVLFNVVQSESGNSAVAAEIPRVAVNKLLLRELFELVVFKVPSCLDLTSCSESPARTALTLEFGPAEVN